MGIGTSSGSISVTDNDHIEVSNLNRQFLFRPANVGQPKSSTACDIAKQMNGSLNAVSHQVLVETDSVFNDQFWQGLDFVVNAVDNINARLFVDFRWPWQGPEEEPAAAGAKKDAKGGKKKK